MGFMVIANTLPGKAGFAKTASGTTGKAPSEPIPLFARFQLEPPSFDIQMPNVPAAYTVEGEPASTAITCGVWLSPWPAVAVQVRPPSALVKTP